MSEENNKIVKIIDSNVVKVDEVNEAIDYKSDARFRQIDNRMASQVTGLLQYVPQAAMANAMRGTFRVEFPEGISGVLAKHGNGFLSVIQGEDGKIAGHATFVPTSETVPAVIGMFTALSVVTSQYFLAQINQNLEEVQRKLDQVLDFLYSDKACEIYAESQGVKAIYMNYPAIMNQPEQKTASIVTIQHAKAVAEKNIQFYYRDMNKRVTAEVNDKGIKVPDFIGNLNDEKTKAFAYSLLDDLNSYNQAINLYSICSILEIVLSQNFADSYLTYVEEDLRSHFKTHNIIISKLEGNLAALTGKRSGSRINSVVKDIQDLLGEGSPEKRYTGIIGQIQEAYNTKSEYRILRDGTVYQKIA
jgi:hypothetical protein